MKSVSTRIGCSKLCPIRLAVNQTKMNITIHNPYMNTYGEHNNHYEYGDL